MEVFAGFMIKREQVNYCVMVYDFVMISFKFTERITLRKLAELSIILVLTLYSFLHPSQQKNQFLLVYKINVMADH